MENEKLNEMIDELWDSLTDEQKAKAKECKTVEELVELAGREMIELPDELLEAVSAAGPLSENYIDYGKICRKKKIKTYAVIESSRKLICSLHERQ